MVTNKIHKTEIVMECTNYLFFKHNNFAVPFIHNKTKTHQYYYLTLSTTSRLGQVCITAVVDSSHTHIREIMTRSSFCSEALYNFRNNATCFFYR